MFIEKTLSENFNFGGDDVLTFFSSPSSRRSLNKRRQLIPPAGLLSPVIYLLVRQQKTARGKNLYTNETLESYEGLRFHSCS